MTLTLDNMIANDIWYLAWDTPFTFYCIMYILHILPNIQVAQLLQR